jgi:predicted nucleic acid-binding protein
VTSGQEAALRRRTQLFVPADEPAFLPQPTAPGVRGAVRALPVARHVPDPLLDRALELSDSMTAHDACYAALAELLDATLMTADLRLARPPGMRCPVVTVSP